MLKKPIVSIMVLAMVVGWLSTVGASPALAAEDKTLIKIAETGEFDEANLFTDGSILTYKEKGDKKIVSKYDDTEDKFVELGEYDFDDWFYSPDGLSSDNFIYRKDEQIGLMDKNGEVLVEPEYDHIYMSPTSDIMFTEKNLKNGLVVRNSGKVLEAKYKNIQYISETKVLLEDNGYSIYDVKTGNETTLDYELVSTRGNEDLLDVRTKDKQNGIIDAGGNVIIAPGTLDYMNAVYLKDNMFLLKKDESGTYNIFDVSENKFKGESLDYDLVYHSNGEFPIVKRGEKYGLIDKDGEEIIAPAYDEIFYTPNDMIVVQKDYNSGLLNNAGKVIVDPIYDSIGTHLDLIMVEKDGKFGLLNSAGDVVVKPTYNMIIDIIDGNIAARTDDGYGIADTKGNVIMDFENDYLVFSGSAIKVVNNGKIELYKYVGKPEELIKEKQYSNELIIKDDKGKELKVSLNTNLSAVEEGTVVVAKIISKDDKEVNKIVEKAIKEVSGIYGEYVVFDISLEKDNIKVQPNGDVQITITIPEELRNKNLAIFRIEDDGGATKLDGKIADGEYYFTTDHFSLYVLAEDNTVAIEDTETSKEQKEDKIYEESPQTGDNTPIINYIALFIISIFGFLLSYRNMRKSREQ